MRRPHLSESVFLSDLTKMYQAAQRAGQHTVWITMKQVGTRTHKKSGKLVGGANPIPVGCLVRATNGKKTTSCVVEARRAKAFQQGLQQAMATNIIVVPKSPPIVSSSIKSSGGKPAIRESTMSPVRSEVSAKSK